MSAWITAWGSAVSIADRRPAMYAKDLTLRYPLLMTLSGSAVRITLDNFCGTEAVTLAYAKAQLEKANVARLQNS